MHSRYFSFVLLSLLTPVIRAQNVTVPMNHCRWIQGSYGDIIYCHEDEVAVGACGSGRDPDCGLGLPGEMG